MTANGGTSGVDWAQLTGDDIIDAEAERVAAEHRDSFRSIDSTDDHGIRSNLPASFWAARPAFGHIRQAAHSRARSADAVFGCVLARVAAMTPPAFNLPAIVGSCAPLTTYVACVGPPGSGKSSSERVAKELLPCDDDGVADDLPLGSGEGLIEAYFEITEELGPNGKPKMVKTQTRHGAVLDLDEGQLFTELGARKGSTLLPMLRTAWSGATLGTTNASIETRRRLPAGSYALGLIIMFQPSMAGDLLGDVAGGTPQRFVWVSATDPTIPDIAPRWPGVLSWRPPVPRTYNGATFTATLTIVDSVRAEVQRRALQVTRGEVDVTEMDAHAQLVRLKIAGLFAILDDRFGITEDDWRLAGVYQQTSRAVRTTMLEHVALEQRQREDGAVRTLIRRETAKADDQVTRARHRMARAISRHVHKNTCDGGCKRRCASRATASGDRDHATLDDALEEATRMHWIRVVGDQITPGEARPT